MWAVEQTYGWNGPDGKPLLPDENKTIATFDTWWRAFLFKLVAYDFASDPAWKQSFIWEVVECTQQQQSS